ncbi:MAG: L-alanine exporter AlaE [Patescibacteria group bacterium]
MFARLRSNPAGYVAMFIGALSSLPVDIYIAEMTPSEFLANRIWFITAKVSFGGQYDRFRDWFLEVSKTELSKLTTTDRLQRVIIDAPCYCLYHVILYTIAIVVQVVIRSFLGTELRIVSSLNAIAFVAVTTFFVGPFFGLVLDGLKCVIERLKTKFKV